MHLLRFFTCFVFFLFVTVVAFGQETIVTGKVTDAQTGEPLPFVNIIFTGSTQGTTTDFDGNFHLSSFSSKTEIQISFMGYHKRLISVKAKTSQHIEVRLEPEIVNLQEVVFIAEENPAFKILKQATKNKHINRSQALESYEYQSYNLLQVDLTKLPAKLKKKKWAMNLLKQMDSTTLEQNVDKPMSIPVFMAESISEVYCLPGSDLRHEKIVKTRAKGIGIEEEGLDPQLLSTGMQQVDFYDNFVKIFKKQFISPLADGGKSYYQYFLMDTATTVGETPCYYIELEPKNSADLAFSGAMWIAKGSFALRKIEVDVSNNANINYVHDIKINQEFEPTVAGPWLPVQTQYALSISPFSDNSTGFSAQSFTSVQNVKVNIPKPKSINQDGVELAEDAGLNRDGFWDKNRPVELHQAEMKKMEVIDSLSEVPVIKTYADISRFLASGYQRIGMVDIGPHYLAYSFNNIEGNRFRLGFKTNVKFSKRWVFKGYTAYGTRDERMKYGVSVDHILSRKNWTVIGFDHKKDIEQVGVNAEELKDDLLNSRLFLAFNRMGTLRRPYDHTVHNFRIKSQISKGITQSFSLKNESFSPLYEFSYLTNPGNPEPVYGSAFTNTELGFETRFSKNEKFIQNGNERLPLNTSTFPILTLGLKVGIKDMMGGMFNYQKISLNLKQTMRLGVFGRSIYYLSSGYIFGSLPYPLLEAHLGNETPMFTPVAFNLMNTFEFVSDHYVSLKYRHHFDGFIFNKIPVIKRLNWRFVTISNIVLGGIRPHNLEVATKVVGSEEVVDFKHFNNDPYVEVGYGIENIFKVLRIDFYHRLTHRNNPDINKFGIKVNFQIIL